MEEQMVTNNQIQQPPVNPVSPKPNYWLIAATVLIFIFVFSGVYTLVLKSQKQMSLLPHPTVSPTISQPSPTSDPTANWKMYIIKAVDLEFKLPPKLNAYGELKEEIIAAPFPFIGSDLTVTFKDKTQKTNETAPIRLGTISIDYNVGRGAGFTDLQGFKIENNKYYAKLLKTSFEIPIESVTAIKNPYGITILKIKGKNSTGENGETEGIILSGTPGDGSIGALINTSNKIYPGIAVEMDLNGILTENDFDQILSTFKFTGQKEQVVCTQDVKRCSDGSYVSRQPPICEFAKCP